MSDGENSAHVTPGASESEAVSSSESTLSSPDAAPPGRQPRCMAKISAPGGRRVSVAVLDTPPPRSKEGTPRHGMNFDMPSERLSKRTYMEDNSNQGVLSAGSSVILPNSVLQRCVLPYLGIADVGRLALTCCTAWRLAKNRGWLRKAVWGADPETPKCRPRLWLDAALHTWALQLEIAEELSALHGRHYMEDQMAQPDATQTTGIQPWHWAQETVKQSSVPCPVNPESLAGVRCSDCHLRSLARHRELLKNSTVDDATKVVARMQGNVIFKVPFATFYKQWVYQRLGPDAKNTKKERKGCYLQQHKGMGNDTFRLFSQNRPSGIPPADNRSCSERIEIAPFPQTPRSVDLDCCSDSSPAHSPKCEVPNIPPESLSEGLSVEWAALLKEPNRHDDWDLGVCIYEYLAGDETVGLSTSKTDEILRDVSRTFPKNSLFSHRCTSGQAWVFRVLKVLACLQPQVGYCQGMNFLCGSLLYHLRCPVAAVWVAVGVLKALHFAPIFSPAVPQVPLRLYQFSQVVKEHLPDVSSHLAKNGLSVDFFAQQWLMSVFAYFVDHDSVAWVWDALLLCGWKTFFKVSLALLFCMRDRILRSDYEAVIQFVQQSRRAVFSPDTSSGTGEGGRFLLRAAARFHVTHRQLEKFRRDYEVEKFQALLVQLPLDLYNRRHSLLMSRVQLPKQLEVQATLSNVVPPNIAEKLSHMEIPEKPRRRSTSSWNLTKRAQEAFDVFRPASRISFSGVNLNKPPHHGHGEPLRGILFRVTRRSLAGILDRMGKLILEVGVTKVAAKLRESDLVGSPPTPPPPAPLLSSVTTALSRWMIKKGTGVQSNTSTSTALQLSPSLESEGLISPPSNAPDSHLSAHSNSDDFSAHDSDTITNALAHFVTPTALCPVFACISLDSIGALHYPYEGAGRVWDFLECNNAAIATPHSTNSSNYGASVAATSPPGSSGLEQQNCRRTKVENDLAAADARKDAVYSVDLSFTAMNLPCKVSLERQAGVPFVNWRFQRSTALSKNKAAFSGGKDGFTFTLGLWGPCICGPARIPACDIPGKDPTCFQFLPFVPMESHEVMVRKRWRAAASGVRDTGYLLLQLKDIVKAAKNIAGQKQRLRADADAVFSKIGSAEKNLHNLYKQQAESIATTQRLLKMTEAMSSKLASTTLYRSSSSSPQVVAPDFITPMMVQEPGDRIDRETQDTLSKVEDQLETFDSQATAMHASVVATSVQFSPQEKQRRPDIKISRLQRINGNVACKLAAAQTMARQTNDKLEEAETLKVALIDSHHKLLTELENVQYQTIAKLLTEDALWVARPPASRLRELFEAQVERETEEALLLCSTPKACPVSSLQSHGSLMRQGGERNISDVDEDYVSCVPRSAVPGAMCQDCGCSLFRGCVPEGWDVMATSVELPHLVSDAEAYVMNQWSSTR